MSLAALKRAAVREARRREATPASARMVDVDALCHPKQAALVKDIVAAGLGLPGAHRNLDDLAGRQSGKSHGKALASDLVCYQRAGINWFYVTSTYRTCERMAFSPAVELNRRLGLGGTPNYGKLSIAWPNGSVAWFMGADAENTIERLRGTPNLAGCILDEAGIYDSDTLKAIIEAVRPGLRPLAGVLSVGGTPSKAGKQGTWYDITQNPHFKHHRFDYRDNDRVPSFADVERLIDEELAAMFPHMSPEQRRRTAYFLREYMAEFVVDMEEKFYQLTEKNLIDYDPPEDLDTYISGGDIGVSANDALVSIGWRDEQRGHGDMFVADQEEASGQDSIACADMVNAHAARRQPLEVAMDPGGLGQKTIKTVQRLYPNVPVTEAEKPPVGLQVRAVNYLLQGGDGWCLKIRRGSKLALQLAGPTWVDGRVGGEIDEHGQHSDLVPALRYAAIKLRKHLPDVLPELTDGDRARQAHRERVQRSERLAKLARQRETSYDPDEFTDDLSDDLDQ